MRSFCHLKRYKCIKCSPPFPCGVLVMKSVVCISGLSLVYLWSISGLSLVYLTSGEHLSLSLFMQSVGWGVETARQQAEERGWGGRRRLRWRWRWVQCLIQSSCHLGSQMRASYKSSRSSFVIRHSSLDWMSRNYLSLSLRLSRLHTLSLSHSRSPYPPTSRKKHEARPLSSPTLPSPSPVRVHGKGGFFKIDPARLAVNNLQEELLHHA